MLGRSLEDSGSPCYSSGVQGRARLPVPGSWAIARHMSVRSTDIPCRALPGDEFLILGFTTLSTKVIHILIS